MITATKHFTIRTPTGALTSVHVGYSTDEPVTRSIADEVIDRLGKLSAQVIKERGSLIEHVHTTYAGHFKPEGPLQ